MNAKQYLEKMVGYVESENAVDLRVVSNDMIDEAAVTQDKTFVTLSLIAYALSKIMSKPHLLKSDRWDGFKKHVIEHLSDGPKPVLLDEVVQDVREFDEEEGNYVTDIIDKARMKQASRVYALGLSLSQACELTGADMSLVSSYVGTTKIHERPYSRSGTVAQRYKNARKVLGG